MAEFKPYKIEARDGSRWTWQEMQTMSKAEEGRIAFQLRMREEARRRIAAIDAVDDINAKRWLWLREEDFPPGPDSPEALDYLADCGINELRALANG